MTTAEETAEETAVFPFAGSTYRGPAPGYDRLRAAEPVARVPVEGGGHTWVVTGYEAAREALTAPGLSRAAMYGPGAPEFPGFLKAPPEMIASMDPPEHTRLRKLVTKAFTVRRIEELRPRIEELVDGLLDGMAAAGSPADLVAGLCSPLPLTVICELLGVPVRDRDDFHLWARQFASVSGPPEQAQQGAANLAMYMSQMIVAKREEPADDLLSALIAARDEDDRLSEQELVVFGYALLGAGFDTTACQLANSVLALVAHHPEQWRRLHEHPEEVPDAVEELLRGVNLFATDTSGFPRLAVEDVTVAGVTIPKGDPVFVILSSANRDAAVFADPDRLDFTREESRRHIAFGHGVHRCLGAPLARLELNIAIGALVRRFPDLRLAVPEEELRWEPGNVNHSLLSLPVAWGGG
ncbi:cytochrome P450 [Streptomyces sp. DH37]|uniref:cytochrome P450 n=1 Tax=Streptomyces sp. DH37 TaxID=3040122 RepID=UPI002442EF30|nr:cytochrome P450 [Streptomyces sp. DH37]MDG9706338.1 cytochrome P450 [Streptomyces sp. DH37]